MDAKQRRHQGRAFLTDFLAGDEAGFDGFYRLHYARLLRFGLTITPEREEVRDQAQDVFVWVYENAAKLAKKEDAETYLLAAIRNRLRKRISRRRVFPTADDNIRELAKPEPAFTEAFFAVETASERARIFARELAKLPARQQQVLYLRYYEDKSYAEIALILDTKVEVVRNFAYRGLQKLRASPRELRQAVLLLLVIQESF